MDKGPIAQVSAIVDDDEQTTKELWSELDKVYRMSNTKMVINLQPDLETLSFEKDENEEKHVERFHFLAPKLTSFDKTLCSQEKVSKLLITLPTRFAPIYMVAEAA